MITGKITGQLPRVRLEKNASVECPMQVVEYSSSHEHLEQDSAARGKLIQVIVLVSHMLVASNK